MKPQPKKLFLDLLPYILYLGISIYFIPYVRHYINPDGIAYITIAKQLMSGDFLGAVNATWSPLFPLLLVPFLKIWPDALLAAKILQIFIGLVFMIIFQAFVKSLSVNESIRRVIIYFLIPLIVYFSYSSVSPDLMFSGILITYLLLLFSKKYRSDPNFGYLIGLIGGIAYIGRTYALAFFLADFVITNIYFYLASKTKADKVVIIKNFTKGVTIFAIVSSLWIYTMYQKYNFVTIGSVGEYGFKIKNPIYQNFPDNSLFALGLITPPNTKYTSIWDDLTYSLPLFPSWSPFESKTNFVYFIKLVTTNIYEMAKVTTGFSIFFIPIFILFLFQLRKFGEKINLLTIAFSIYSLGFLPFEFVERHYWFSVILFIIFSTLVINQYIERYTKPKTIFWIVIIFLISLLAKPYGFIKDFFIPPQSIFQDQNKMYYLGLDIKNHGIKGNIVSNSTGTQTIVISYLLDSHYYGVDNKNISSSRLKELKKQNIDFYFYWKDSQKIPTELLKNKVFENDNLIIFKI